MNASNLKVVKESLHRLLSCEDFDRNYLLTGSQLEEYI